MKNTRFLTGNGDKCAKFRFLEKMFKRKTRATNPETFHAHQTVLSIVVGCL